MFGLFLTLARPKPLEPPANRELDLEHFFMIGTTLTDNAIGRNAAKFFLGILLQFALVVAVTLMQGDKLLFSSDWTGAKTREIPLSTGGFLIA